MGLSFGEIIIAFLFSYAMMWANLNTNLKHMILDNDKLSETKLNKKPKNLKERFNYSEQNKKL